MNQKTGVSDEHKIEAPLEHKDEGQQQPVEINVDLNKHKQLADAWDNHGAFTPVIQKKIIGLLAGTDDPATRGTSWKHSLFTVFKDVDNGLSESEKRARAFFQNKEFINQATEARRLYEAGDMEGALALVRAYPALLYYSVTMPDDRGTKKELVTLLQAAGMDYDVNFGMVERIIDLGLLPEDEIRKQLDYVLPRDWSKMTPKRWRDYGLFPGKSDEEINQEIKALRQHYDAELKRMLHAGLSALEREELHRCGEDELLPWQLITAIRMQPYKDALDKLMKGIVAEVRHQQAEQTWDSCTYKQLKEACRDIICEFHAGIPRNFYQFAWMSDLPSNDSEQAEAGTIYVSRDGYYVVRDPAGVVQTGTLDTDLSHLENTFDVRLKQQILAVISKAGHTQVTPGEPVKAGLVFDPAIFFYFINDTYWNNRMHLGGWASIASDLLWDIACGTLQKIDTQCGRDVHRTGVYKVAIDGLRSERGAGKVVPDGLGNSFIFSLYDGWPDHGGARRRGLDFFKTYINQKRLHYATAYLRHGRNRRPPVSRLDA